MIESNGRGPAEQRVAIIGVSCRFAGAPDPRALWRLLLAGEDSIRDVPGDRWSASAHVDRDRRAPGKMVSARGAFLDSVSEFDASFFSISAREAAQIDPQQRLALELAWEALESAGVAVDRLHGSDTAVFMGAMWNDYAYLHGLADIEQHSAAGWDLGIIAGRIAYALGLRGPSMSVTTGCSSSLVAVHLACKALASGETSLALAGGINLMLTPRSSVAMSKFGGLARGGRCFAYDARAEGYVRGEGGGVVALRRYDDAIARGDRIIAVICGSGVNSDGATPGLSVPSEDAQRSLLRQVYARAGVDPRDVAFVEGHGTGTVVGDPIEARALGAELGRDRGQPLRLGSLKPNIGHTEAASGIASLIKTALALDAGVIPPNRDFVEPSPAIDFPALGLVVPTRPEEWRGPRIAGVNSFSFGGTNCHVVLSGAPRTVAASDRRTVVSAGDGRYRLIAVSARDDAALDARIEQLRELVDGQGDNASLDDLAHTTWHRRTHLERRAFICAASREQLRARLAEGQLPRGSERVTRPRVVFAFSGQGSQWGAMGRELVRLNPAFRRALAECSAALEARTGWSVLAAVEAGTLEPHVATTDGIQPAVFAVQVALAATWRALGVEPDAVIGHSLGEIAAAVVAGALSVDDGAAIVAARARLMARLSGAGSMLSVGLPSAELEALLAERLPGAALGVAVDLGVGVTSVSGEISAIAQLRCELERRHPEVEVRAIAVDVAAHSEQLDVIAEEFLDAVAHVQARPETVEMFSSVTGGRVAHRPLSPGYWLANLRDRVRFGEAATELLLAEGPTTILEVSPHPLLCWPLSELAAKLEAAGASAFPTLRRGRAEHEQLLSTAGELHIQGVKLGLEQPGQLIDLPAYPWQRRRYWPTESRAPAPVSQPSDPRSEVVLRVERRKLAELAEHRVDGESLVSAGVALELIVRAWSVAEPSADLLVEGLRFQGPLDGERPVRLELGDGEVSIGPEGAQEGPSASPCVVARVGEPKQGAEPRRPGTAQAHRLLDAETHYARLEAAGLSYGSSLRSIASLSLGVDTALARLDPATSRAAVFDAVFQTIGAASVGPTPYIVAGVSAIRAAVQRLSSAISVRVEEIAQHEKGRLLDAWLLDRDGAVVACFERVRLVERARAKAPIQLKRRSWRLLERAPATTERPTSVALYRVPSTGCAHLLEHLTRSRELRLVHDLATADVLVVLCPAGPGEDPSAWIMDACERIIAAVRSALAVDSLDRPRVVVVSERAVDAPGEGEVNSGGPALAALVRVIAAEHDGVRLCALDLGDFGSAFEARALASALSGAERRQEVAIRGAFRFAPHFAAVDAPARAWTPPSGTIVVTGALGGIGRAVVERLASRGAERIVLVGRRALDDKTRFFLDELATRTNASLRYVSVNIADREALHEALAPELERVRGVLHAAADFANALALDHDRVALRAAIDAKVTGAWNLHCLTKGHALDFFVLFGSMGAWLGLPGQAGYAAANAALDGLARYRRARSLPALCISWCGWEGLGFAQGASGRAALRRLAGAGVGIITPDEGLDLLTRLLAASSTLPASVAVQPVDETATAKATQRRLWRERIEGLTDVRRCAALREVVIGEVATTFREDPARVDPLRPLREQGLDSLMSVEVSERIGRAFGLDAPATLVWRYPNVEALVRYAMTELLDEGEGGRAEPDEAVHPDEMLGALERELDDMSDDEVEALLREL